MNQQLTVMILMLSLFCAGCKNDAVKTTAPKITHLSWGAMKVQDSDGTIYEYKDCKVWPTGSREWVWNETGTRHVPGIQIADLQDFINQVDVVVLSKGMDEILQTKPETFEYLKQLGKTVYVEQTEKAVKKYNDLVSQGRKVGGLFHSTC